MENTWYKCGFLWMGRMDWRSGRKWYALYVVASAEVVLDVVGGGKGWPGGSGDDGEGYMLGTEEEKDGHVVDHAECKNESQLQ
jgi:hypothetical protein